MALRYALLAALQEQPATGYELTQRFRTRLANVWNASHQQVYRELGRLLEEKMLLVEDIPQTDKPDKKRYHVTLVGRQALKSWLDRPQPRPPVRDPLLVKLFAGELLDLDALADELSQRRQDAVAQLGYFRVIEHTYFRKPERMGRHFRLQHLALRRGMLAEESWLAWLDEAETLLADLRAEPADATSEDRPA